MFLSQPYKKLFFEKQMCLCPTQTQLELQQKPTKNDNCMFNLAEKLESFWHSFMLHIRLYIRSCLVMLWRKKQPFPLLSLDTGGNWIA